MIEPYYQEENIMIYNNDCLEVLKQIPSESIDCVMTSPPYWALRCYLPGKVKMKDNLTPEEKEYVEKELALLGVKSYEK